MVYIGCSKTECGRFAPQTRPISFAICTEQKHTKYWLWKQMDMSYQNFNRIVNNETSSIRFDNLDKISQLLNVPVGDLFKQTKDIQ